MLRAIRDEHEIVAVIEEWRELTRSSLNTYLGPLPTLIGEDGRLHTTINQTVAATGRLSTSNPNLQAIPIRTELGREIRSAFVAEPGYRLLSADYSQIELRILAHVSGEPKLREAFARGEDIHTATAAEVLGKDPATLTKDERNVAKMINFGIVYGISAFGLSENLDIPREEAQAYIDAYLARFPHVQDVHRAHDRAGGARTATRRACSAAAAPFRSSARRTGRRAASASASPSTSSCRARTRTSSRWRWSRSTGACARRGEARGSSSRCTTSSCSRCPRPRSSAVRELVREEMCGAYPLDPPLAVDVGVGDDWAEAKVG